MLQTPQQLLAACESARQEGKDFPTVWRTVLQRSPLVIGLPGHEIRDGEARIIISLTTGQQIGSSLAGYTLG
ncbi:MAG: hypothetical protein QM759_10205 [Terricaulis sp.]